MTFCPIADRAKGGGSCCCQESYSQTQDSEEEDVADLLGHRRFLYRFLSLNCNETKEDQRKGGDKGRKCWNVLLFCTFSMVSVSLSAEQGARKYLEKYFALL